jgi:hypothetical protein
VVTAINVHEQLCGTILESAISGCPAQIKALELARTLATQSQSVCAIRHILRFALGRVHLQRALSLRMAADASQASKRARIAPPPPPSLDTIAAKTVATTAAATVIATMWSLLCRTSDDGIVRVIDAVQPDIDALVAAIPAGNCETAASQLLLLLGEQDDVLIAALLQLLEIDQMVASAMRVRPLDTPHPLQAVLSRPKVSALRSALSWRVMFEHFAEFVGHDHLVLVDLLLGDETVFLQYFVQYLKLATNLRSPVDSSHATPASPTPPSAVPSAGIGDALASTEQSCEGVGMRVSTEETLLETQCNVDNEHVSRTIHGLLGRLYTALERMHTRGLFPYNVKPLLQRLASVLR